VRWRPGFIGVAIGLVAVLFTGRQFPACMAGMDRSVAELAATPVTDQAATGEQVNNRVQQGHHTQDEQAQQQLPETKQDHRDQRGEHDKPEPGHLREILAHEQFAASADRTSAQFAMIVQGLVPVQIDLAAAIRRFDDRRRMARVDLN